MRVFVLCSTLVAVGAGCKSSGATPPSATPQDDASPPDSPRAPLEILEDLETKIARGSEQPDDRVRAYEEILALPDDQSAAYAFARAALAGRLAEKRGAGAGKLVSEAERWARTALQRDPDYDDGAATRMLGSLYVMAPGRLVEHGDSESGLTMLENLADSRPDDPRNHLRLAEAFIFLGDLDAAVHSVCRAVASRDAFRPDEKKLLDGLIEEYGGKAELGCVP